MKALIPLFLGLYVSTVAAAGMPPVKLLIIDADAVLEQSTVARRLRADAEVARTAADGADGRERVEASLDLALSALLEALPGLIEQLATARGVDLVVGPVVASQIGAKGPDLTAEIVKVLDRDAASVQLELP